MKIKFNWGFGIAATYIGFVLATLIMVVIFMRQDVTLETKEYYAKGLAYQEQIEKMNRANNLKEPLTINVIPNSIKISFPKTFKREELKGSIILYRPANDNSDFTIDVSPDTSRVQLISTIGIAKGLWKVRIDWNANGINYFNETPIMVN
jgi:hypothetical protein